METSQEDEHYSNDGQSDDDLLSPTSFLYCPNSYQNVHTPEKIKTPTNNDLSPLTSVEQQETRKKHHKKYSLRKLITEKAAQDEVDKHLTMMDSELKEGIQKGGILSMMIHKALDDTQEFSDAFPLEDFQDEDLLPQHQIELEKVNEGFHNDFPDGFPGEAMFLLKSSPGDTSIPEELRNLLGMPSKNELDAIVREIFSCGFLVDLALLKEMDEIILEWLLCCICHSSDIEKIEGAFKAYWTTITSSKTAQKAWHFSTTNFLKRLMSLGTNGYIMFSTKTLLDEFSGYLDMNSKGTIKDESSAISKATGDNDMLPIHVQTLLKCYSSSLKGFPQKYSRQDITCTLLVAFRLSIDLDIISESWEIQVLLGCAVDCYDETQWDKEITNICRLVPYITQNHSNRLQFVEIIPVTKRGLELKRILALKFLSCAYSTSVLDVNNSMVSNVFNCIKKIYITEETDYHALFSTISLVNSCLPDDAVATCDKKRLEELITTLTALNSEIRDPGGRYMNRTKVKDLILRVIARLSFISHGLKTQTNLDGFFGSAESSFNQLQFETIEDRVTGPENDEEESEGNEEMPDQGPTPTGYDSLDCTTDDESINGSELNEDPLIDLVRRKQDMNKCE